jgi:hypothetical protein
VAKQCIGRKKNGEQCDQAATLGNYCFHHYTARTSGSATKKAAKKAAKKAFKKAAKKK